jgi:FMN phosphatase YigB (HAD superfamily)
VTHLLFDLYGTMVDADRMRICYAEQLGHYLSESFRGTAAAWSDAYHRIVADWDSYYDDLDLNGEHGLADLREGEIRVTHALFRLTGTPEPIPESLSALARHLAYYVSRRCDAFYADGKPVLARLHTAGHMLGVASHTTSAHTRGILEGAGVMEWFAGTFLSPDVTKSFRKNRVFFRDPRLNPADCILIDDQEEGIQGAKAAGMRAVQVLRQAGQSSPLADHVLHGDLTGLLAYLGIG